MFKNNVVNSFFIDDYKNDQKQDYMNIAKRNEENFKNKEFEKFKPKDSFKNITNLLKGEESKLKKMLFSILKNEEAKNLNVRKSPKNHYKTKLSNVNLKTNILSSIEDESQIKATFNKNYKQIKKNSKKIKLKIFRKIKKSISESELVESNFTPKNKISRKCISPQKIINSKLCISPQKNIQKSFSFEKSKLKKEIQNINSPISNAKKSRNSIYSFYKSEKEYNKNDNQTSTQCLNLSFKNETQRTTDQFLTLSNKNRKRNTLNVNKSEMEKLKNICIFNNKNTQNDIRSYTLKNHKNFIEENFNINTLSCNKSVSSISFSPKKANEIKNSTNFIKSDKDNNKIKINNHKMFEINKEKKNFIIQNDDQKIESKLSESPITSNRKNLPIISDSSNSSPQRFWSTKDSTKDLPKLSSKIYTDEKLKKKDININKLTKTTTIIDERFRKLIHRRLVYDSFDDEESEFEETTSNNFYIDPKSTFCFIFDLIIFCFTIYTSITIPYFLAKNIRECKGAYFSFFHFFNCFSEILNIIDTILGFFRAYYNYDEQLIKKSKLMISHYINSWFLVDLISSIPFYTIFNSNETECTKEIFNKYYSNQIHNLHYLFLCIKMIKLWKVFKNNRGFKRTCRKFKHYFIFKENGALIAKTYMTILIFHFGACIQIFVARNSYPNWITNSKMETNKFSEIYICAIYCLTMTITSVGYGDITCYSFNERILQIVLLIFGIFAYSWIVSSISSYIEKYHNDLNDLTNKIDILKDIKLHYPNMPDKLYYKIMQHLKYKNRQEKHNKNLIFDCLPQCLKNNLIFEMYKPIITKFIFFKNIDNIDFIVKVILAFRPVIAVKNDIIVNDGDMVEEIVFVKKGVLIVQLLINLENYEENIKKYSTINLFNLQNVSSLDKTINSSDTALNNKSIIEKLINHDKKRVVNSNSLIDMSFNNKTSKDILCEDKNSKYIKIINIRENEHFGDVLMFSGQRSPMRLMVRSTKAELFILNKEDVVKISFAYNNIWRRINEKSVYNFEQMKKNILKIVEVFSPQNLQTTLFINNYENESNEFLVNKKIGYKKNDTEFFEEKESKNISKNKNYNSVLSSLNLESIDSSEIEKEKKNKNKSIGMKESVKEENKFDNTLISSTQSIIDYNSKYFLSESIRKSKQKNQTYNIPSNKINDYSVKFSPIKNDNYLYSNTNSNKNNKTPIRSKKRFMTTPYKKEEINQEIYDNEKFELTNVDENCDNLLSNRKLPYYLIKNENNINEINSKSKIINDYVIDKLNSINIISNKNNDNNNIISKGDYFSIEFSYENFNSLSKNILIKNKNLQKKLRLFLKKQIMIPNLSQSIIHRKNFNLDFPKTNEGNLVDNINKINRLSNHKRDSQILLNNLSSDHKIQISRDSLTPISRFNNFKKDSNEVSLNSFTDSIKKIPIKTRSHLSLNRILIRKNLNEDCSFRPLNKSRITSLSKTNKSIDKIITRPNKSNKNLLSLINDNILNVTQNLIEPDKFYRRYFNTLINNNSYSNNQINNKKENYRCTKTRNDFSFYAEKCNSLSPKKRPKRHKI